MLRAIFISIYSIRICSRKLDISERPQSVKLDQKGPRVASRSREEGQAERNGNVICQGDHGQGKQVYARFKGKKAEKKSKFFRFFWGNVPSKNENCKM